MEWLRRQGPWSPALLEYLETAWESWEEAGLEAERVPGAETSGHDPGAE